MKLLLLTTLIVLSTLLYEAQGINRKLMTKTISSSSITTANAITSKKHNNEENKEDPKLGNKSLEENLANNLSSKHLKYEKPEANPPGYTDIVDLTGMDYSPARRKPPIHN